MEYADGATVLIANDSREQICEGMGKYDVVAETVERKIKWAKVSLLTRTRPKPAEQLPQPIDQI